MDVRIEPNMAEEDTANLDPDLDVSVVFTCCELTTHQVQEQLQMVYFAAGPLDVFSALL